MRNQLKFHIDFSFVFYDSLRFIDIFPFTVPKMLLNKRNKANEKESSNTIKFAVTDKLCEHFYSIHQTCQKIGATPRLYLSFLQNYVNVYTEKRSGIEKRRGHLQVSEDLVLELYKALNSRIKTGMNTSIANLDWNHCSPDIVDVLLEEILSQNGSRGCVNSEIFATLLKTWRYPFHFSF